MSEAITRDVIESVKAAVIKEVNCPLVSPVYAKGLPHAIVICADNDNLKHEGKLFPQMLLELT